MSTGDPMVLEFWSLHVTEGLDACNSVCTMFSVCFRFSGVTAESLHGVTTTIHEVQAVLLSMIHRDTILVGHSLESDLKATKVPCTNNLYLMWGWEGGSKPPASHTLHTRFLYL